MRDGRPGEAGFAMAALIVTLAVMLLAISAAAPTWRYIVKDDKEQELIFRGNQIADAIWRFKAKNGQAVPPTLEVLVKGKFLRRAYKDPMTESGEWRLVHLGETVGVPGLGVGGLAPKAPKKPSPFSTAGQTMGGIVAVASTSQEEGLRRYNGRSKYSEWVFGPEQPCVVGDRPVCNRGTSPSVLPGGNSPGPRPGSGPPLSGGPQ